MTVDWQMVATVAALLGFNVPILYIALKLQKVPNLNQALQEKTSDGSSTGDVSYSRVTGMIGAVVVTAFFWIISNITIGVAILHPENLKEILSNIGSIFLVGAALFLPYAFNQIKSVIQ